MRHCHQRHRHHRHHRHRHWRRHHPLLYNAAAAEQMRPTPEIRHYDPFNLPPLSGAKARYGQPTYLLGQKRTELLTSKWNELV